MFRSMKDLEDYAVGATDGELGHVKDFYFDDQSWVIRYLIVETGEWLSSRQVLISPSAVHKAEWTDRLLPVALTKDQVRHAPDIDTSKPVSRQHEMDYYGYYGYPYYWGGVGLWGDNMMPYAVLPGGEGFGSEAAARAEADLAYAKAERRLHANDDPHLRSCQAVIGYEVHAKDGDVGHISDLLVDESTWAVRYVVINTGHWWRGHRVLVSPQWITEIDWSHGRVTVDVTKQSVKDAPVFESTEQLNRQSEADLYEHHGRAVYWPLKNT